MKLPEEFAFSRLASLLMHTFASWIPHEPNSAESSSRVTVPTYIGSFAPSTSINLNIASIFWNNHAHGIRVCIARPVKFLPAIKPQAAAHKSLTPVPPRLMHNILSRLTGTETTEYLTHRNTTEPNRTEPYSPVWTRLHSYLRWNFVLSSNLHNIHISHERVSRPPDTR